MACGTAARRLMRELGYVALIALAASLPYINSLDGKYCYDDKVAVAGNPDVYKKEVTFNELITHDFWGNDMLNRRGYGWTHHSWRPLIVLSFRWDHAMGSGHPFPFHASNVLYHALSALAAYLTYRVLFPSAGEIGLPSGGPRKSVSSRALLAAVLFAVHPVHSECVANITSRADAVASIFQLAAVALYVAASGRIVSELKDAIAEARGRRSHRRAQLQLEGRESGLVAGEGCGAIIKGILCPCLRPSFRPQRPESRCRSMCRSTAKWLLAAAGYFLLLLVSLACKETSLVVPFLCVCYDIAVAMARSAVSCAADIDNNENDEGASAKRPQRGWFRLSLAYLRRLVFFELPWLKSMLVFAFGYLVYYVRIVIVAKGYTLETWANPIHNSLYHTKDKLERVLSIALVQAFALSKLVFPLYLSHEHNAFKHVTGFFEARNALTVVIWACLFGVVALALWCLWRAMLTTSATVVTAPAKSVNAEKEEDSALAEADADAFASPASASPAQTQTLLYLARAFLVLFGLAWVAVSYFPSSHAVQYVAFILAERTLYLPSFGACIILAELLSALAGHPSTSTSTASSSNDSAGFPSSLMVDTSAAGLSSSSSSSASASDPSAVHHYPSSPGSVGSAAALTPSSPSRNALAGSHSTASAASTPSKGPKEKEEKEKRTRFVLGYRIKLPGKTNSASVAYQQKMEKRGQQQDHEQEQQQYDAQQGQEQQHGGPGETAASSASSSSSSSLRSKLVGSRRRTFATLVTSLLLSWYVVRTYTRNWDWVNEEELMSANLHHYPEGNVMTIYGLGAVALYKGEIDKAEKYLVRACNESSMVEPHILLSQLYWKHRLPERSDALDIAQSELEYVASTSTPRKEILTNLGMLMYKKAKSNDTETLKQAEYYVLAAAVAHGYPEGHHSIAQLASNAGCMRLMSHKDRYGDAQAAERLVNEALEVARNSGGTATAFKNAATFYAVQGYAPHALSILEEGISHLEAALLQALQTSETTGYSGQKASVVQYYQELLYSMQRQMVTIQLHAPLLASWASSGPPVIGEEAEPRMSTLGVDCILELLWW